MVTLQLHVMCVHLVNVLTDARKHHNHQLQYMDSETEFTSEVWVH